MKIFQSVAGFVKVGPVASDFAFVLIHALAHLVFALTNSPHCSNYACSLLEDREVVLYCDLHGHSRHQNIFIYGCTDATSSSSSRSNNNTTTTGTGTTIASEPGRRLQERVFPYMLSRNAPDMFSYKHCRFHVQKNKEGTGRVVVWNMGIQNSYTLEVRLL